MNESFLNIFHLDRRFVLFFYQLDLILLWNWWWWLFCDVEEHAKSQQTKSDKLRQVAYKT